MAANKKELAGGIGLMAVFLIVLVMFFMPLLNGKNGLDYLDNLFNSISKGSAYYIPSIKETIGKSETGKEITVKLSYDSAELATESAALFSKAGATVTEDAEKLNITGDFGNILMNCLEDSDALFHNKGDVLQEKYGIEGRKVLFNWWTSLKAMKKSFDKQEQFANGKTVYTVMTRAVECSYNYYKIVPESMSNKLGTVIFSLVFYVVYTMWYGYAILFMFEGWGLQIGH
ncbi:MAG: hypothetical protein KBG98_09215 [Desulfobacter sp.]|jgi:hypothetical protein|uniref:hypothetical protein n=1 Tax=Desulfobacter sp. TaxID=2294 RepID=UPI001B692D66|nr:hypothetical protein [Desulfobacter sp.]MBP8829818.1 hypothetical protein [Desulfobacter sp.]MBP9598437.1 hypothetical protein [Desulfobacter sp.]